MRAPLESAERVLSVLSQRLPRSGDKHRAERATVRARISDSKSA